MYSFLEDPKYHRHHIGKPQLLDIWNNYIDVRRATWNEEEIFQELSKDYSNKNKLPAEVLDSLSWILKFFAVGDDIVNEVSSNIIDRISHLEIKFLLRQFMVQEDIHNIVYTQLCETYARSKEELENMYNAVKEVSSVQEKANWNKHWLKNANIQQSLICNVITEGLFFSSSFCFIFWLDNYFPALLPGIKLANKWIAKDEFNHQSTGVKLYHMCEPLDVELITEILTDALNTEKKFVKEIFSGISFQGMNEKLMTQYVEFIADEIAVSLGIPPITNTEDPFPWMIKNRMNNSAGDFFTRTLPEYNKPDKTNYKICFNEDF